MSLEDYVVKYDKFELHESGTIGLELSFPCCHCQHRHKQETQEPCRSCGHNVNAKNEDIDDIKETQDKTDGLNKQEQISDNTKQLYDMLKNMWNIDITVTPDSNLRQDLGVDDLDIVMLLSDVEEAFSVVIPNSEWEHIQTVADIIKYI